MNNTTYEINFDSPESMQDKGETSGQPQVIKLEPMMHKFFDDRIKELNNCVPARVVGIQRREDLLLSVQPLIMAEEADGGFTEPPIIDNVQMFCYGTDDSAVLLPIKQNQTVMLLYSERSLDEFKSGSITPYAPAASRSYDILDAICLPSIFPHNRSPNRISRHFTDHSPDDMTVVNNIGTGRENKVVLRNNGAVAIQSMQEVRIDAPNTYAEDVLHCKKLVAEDDVIVNGRSLVKFMDTHNHNYTDNGTLMTTAVPNGG